MARPACTPRERDQRNLHPHAEAVAAMYLWCGEYGNQNGGSMDFWDALNDRRKEYAREAVKKIREAKTETR